MLVSLSTDQEVLRDSTASYLDDLMPVATVRGLRDDPAGYSRSYWARGADLGWTSLLVGEERGGGTVSGYPLQDLGLIAYEFGTHAAPGPLTPVNVVASALADLGTTAQHAVLDDLLSGAATAAWCFGGYVQTDPARPADVLIRADGDELVISGAQRPIENAGEADYFLVTAGSGASMSQVLLRADSPGVSIEPLESADLTRRFGIVRFDDVRVPADAAVGALDEATQQVDRQLQLAILTQNAESVGAMQRAFEMTQLWTADRYSFGRPLASYQEIKHRMADMLSWLEGSHAINDAAIAAFDAGAPEVDELTSAAKAFIGHYGGELLQDCVQIHGGIGVTFEHDLHLFLRRVTVNRALYGTPTEHRRVLGRLASQRKDTA